MGYGLRATSRKALITQPQAFFPSIHVASSNHVLAAVAAATTAVNKALLTGDSCINDHVSDCYIASLQAAVNKALLSGESCISDCVSDCYLASLQAALIEYNLEAVDGAINAVREALASGLDWRELGQMIKAERRAGNPVAGLIDSLALDKNKITVVLENFLDEEDADDEAMTRPATKVGSQE